MLLMHGEGCTMYCWRSSGARLIVKITGEASLGSWGR